MESKAYVGGLALHRSTDSPSTVTGSRHRLMQISKYTWAMETYVNFLVKSYILSIKKGVK